MKINIVSLSLILATILLSCQKDNLEIDMKTDVPLIRNVVIANQPFYEYSYNYDNLISAEKSKFNITKYLYNDKNQLVTTDYYSDNDLLSNDLAVLKNILASNVLLNLVNSEKGGTLKYEYNNYGQLIKTIVSRPQDSSPEYSEFSYDENDRIGRQTLFWDIKVAGYIDYLYDGSGNLIKETLYSILSSGLAELSTTKQYEFDNYHNPFKSFNKSMTPGINTNPNNIIKETLTMHSKPGQGTDIVQITSTSYDYNSQGYPIRKDGSVEYLYK
jgi:hypothetical protein